MTIDIAEGGLLFQFPDDWTAVKYDARNGFAERQCRIDGTKRVDILALGRKRLTLIEVKDFSGHAMENRGRLTTDGDDPLHAEVAKKVRDTLSVLVAAYRHPDEALSPFCEHLFGGQSRDVEIILFLEEDKSRAKKATGRRDRGGIGHELKKLLKMYRVRCHVQWRHTLPADSPWKVDRVSDKEAEATKAAEEAKAKEDKEARKEKAAREARKANKKSKEAREAKIDKAEEP